MFVSGRLIYCKFKHVHNKNFIFSDNQRLTKSIYKTRALRDYLLKEDYTNTNLKHLHYQPIYYYFMFNNKI